MAHAPSPVSAQVGVANVELSARALSTLPRIDYADRFSLSTRAEAGPERWARAMFGDVPTPAERFIWSGLLGLRLHRGHAPETVAGWRVAGHGQDWILLRAVSWMLTGNLLVQRGHEEVSLTTMIGYDRGMARLVWPPLSAVHRRLSPGLLLHARQVVGGAVPR
ncbi:hypothetical protein [Nonomuraea longicatena]|uniref:DUF2867 domain-containing protein n=1 Tax=Nonomuraea longicatena TaxID=83682 RepID=A0ABP4ANT1_9ACTN